MRNKDKVLVIKNGKRQLYNLKHIQLELAKIIKPNCKVVFIEDAASINIVLWVDEFALCIPKLVAFETWGFVDPDCNFELRKYGYTKKGRVKMGQLEYIEEYPKEEIIKVLLENGFLEKKQQL